MIILDTLLLINVVTSVLLSIVIFGKKGIKSIFILTIFYLFMIDFLHIMYRESVMYDFFLIKFILLIPNAIYGLLALLHTKQQIKDKDIFRGYLGYFLITFMLILIFLFTDKVVRQDSSYIILTVIINLFMLLFGISSVRNKMEGSDPVYNASLRINLRLLYAFMVITGGHISLYLLSVGGIDSIPDYAYFSLYFISLGAMFYIAYNEVFSKEAKFIAEYESNPESFNIEQLQCYAEVEKPADEIITDETIDLNRKTRLSEEEVTRIATKIEEFFRNNKEFQRDSQKKMQDLAELIDEKQNDISYVLNSHFKLSYNNYINSLRIEEAKTILLKDQSNIKIENVGAMVGFNTKNSFYLAFQKFTGVTPASFRENNS